MKRLPVVIAIAVVFATALLVTSVAAVPIPCEDEDLNGNCAPSGNHFTLNLIGKDKTDILPNDANSGHRIFVNLYATHDGTDALPKNKIYLTNTTLTTNDFRVIDADATDGRGEFGLPGATGYLIYIRELGKPGGTGRITTCYTDEFGADWCLFGELDVPLARNTGKSVFRDVTEELTNLCYLEVPEDPESDVICESIFSDALKDYYWNYDNNGLRNVQLRFYPD